MVAGEEEEGSFVGGSGVLFEEGDGMVGQSGFPIFFVEA